MDQPQVSGSTGPVRPTRQVDGWGVAARGANILNGIFWMLFGIAVMVVGVIALANGQVIGLVGFVGLVMFLIGLGMALSPVRPKHPATT